MLLLMICMQMISIGCGFTGFGAANVVSGVIGYCRIVDGTEFDVDNASDVVAESCRVVVV
jgi:hypothetical protein